MPDDDARELQPAAGRRVRSSGRTQAQPGAPQSVPDQPFVSLYCIAVIEPVLAGDESVDRAAAVAEREARATFHFEGVGGERRSQRLSELQDPIERPLWSTAIQLDPRSEQLPH